MEIDFNTVVHLDIEGVDGNHFAAHAVGPFQHLRMVVDEERVEGPSPEDHDVCRRDVIDEKSDIPPAESNRFFDFLRV
jgi:hypothetical protein